MALSVDQNLCPQNHSCPLVAMCPEMAITQQGFQLPIINEHKCIECGICKDACGKQAIYKIQ